MKACDNKSVGILVPRGGCLLMIERRRPPFGWAPPAGHVDDFGSFERAAEAELYEETGLRALRLILVSEGRRENWCRRGGTWHYWKIYSATTMAGPVTPSLEETRGFRWVSIAQLQSGDLPLPIEPVWQEIFLTLDLRSIA